MNVHKHSNKCSRAIVSCANADKLPNPYFNMYLNRSTYGAHTCFFRELYSQEGEEVFSIFLRYGQRTGQRSRHVAAILVTHHLQDLQGAYSLTH